MVELFADNGDPEQMLHSLASGLGLHCLPVSLLGVSCLQWVNLYTAVGDYMCPGGVYQL